MLIRFSRERPVLINSVFIFSVQYADIQLD